jgi:hypothetical protein
MLPVKYFHLKHMKEFGNTNIAECRWWFANLFDRTCIKLVNYGCDFRTLRNGGIINVFRVYEDYHGSNAF